MAKYQLLSGEAIDLDTLTNSERAHISEIEGKINKNEDYFDLYRLAYKPLTEGKGFTAETLRKTFESPHYQIISDILERYRKIIYGI